MLLRPTDGLIRLDLKVAYKKAAKWVQRSEKQTNAIKGLLFLDKKQI